MCIGTILYFVLRIIYIFLPVVSEQARIKWIFINLAPFDFAYMIDAHSALKDSLNEVG